MLNFKVYDDKFDTSYLINNRERIITSIANCDVDSWQMTGGFCNVLETIDDKHYKLRHHRDVVYDLSNIKNKQLFEQMFFKIYNVGHFKCLKRNYQYNETFIEHFSFMAEFFDSLPFTRIREILIIILPAGVETVIHKDPGHLNPDRFIYITEDLNKPFFIYDEISKERKYISSYSAEWGWDLWHGADATDYATFAFKVKGDIL